MNVFIEGQMYDHGHFSRSTCCRVIDSIQERLPATYFLNHPYVGRVSLYEYDPNIDIDCTLSINWSYKDDDIEVTEGITGKTIER